MASAGEDVQITCRFVTRLPEKFRIAPTPLAVPGALTRYGLSEVVNHLLALDPPKPFDFLVDGELVRTSLRKLLLRKAISAEKTLDVEYIPAVGPPAETSVGKHEDWISAVDGGFAGAIATGCYDGTVGLWSPSGTRLLTVAVPNAANNAITSVALLPTKTRDGDGTNHRLALVAGAHDGVARLWDATFSGKRASANASRVFVATPPRSRRSPPRPRRPPRPRPATGPRVWRREGGAATTAAGRRSAKGRRRLRQRRKASAKGVAEHTCPRRAREVVPGLRRRRGRRRRAAAPLGAELVLGDQ